MCFSTQVSLDVLVWGGKKGFGDWKSNQLLLFIHLSSLVRIKVALQIVLQEESYMWGKAVKWTQTIHDSDMKGYGRHHMSDSTSLRRCWAIRKQMSTWRTRRNVNHKPGQKWPNADSLCDINFNEVKRHETMYIHTFPHAIPESVAVSMLAALLWASWWQAVCSGKGQE